MRRALLPFLAASAVAIAACSDRTGPVGPAIDETLAGKQAPAGCLGVEQQELADGIRNQIGELFIGRGGQNPATQQLNNIERKLCQAQYDDALNKAWGFLGLVNEKMPNQFSGDAGDAAALASEVFVLVAADPNPADPVLEIPEGAFNETGGITTFDPADASAEDPIIATTGNNEAAVVVDAPDVFPPGSGPVTIVLARAPESIVTTPGGFIPGFQAFEEGYEILSSHQPWAEGPGALVALCVVPPIPEDANPAIGHLHGEAVSLLVPTDPDPQALGYIDCSDVEPFPGGGEFEAFGWGQAVDGERVSSVEGGPGASWKELVRRMIEPVAQFIAPEPLSAGILGVAGPGLGGRTKSFSLDAPVDARIDVGESVQLSAGSDVTWSSSDEGVATVDAVGLLTGTGPGTATITADFGNGETLTLVVTVEGEAAGGSLIVFASGRDGDVEIYAMNLDGTGQTNLTNAPSSTDNAPTWSPDGTRIAFVSNVSEVDRIYTMDPDGTDVIGPLGTGAFTAWPDWSPDGTMIAYTDGARVHVMNADGTGDFTLPVPVPGVMDWSPDGSQFVVDSGGDILVLSSDGSGAQTALTTGGLLDSGPRWSPDGTKIAFSREDPGVTNPDIYVMDADGTNVVNLTNDAAFDLQPSWSPDGSQIYFWSNRTGPVLVHVMNADGTGATALTSAGPDFDPERQPVEPPVVE